MNAHNKLKIRFLRFKRGSAADGLSVSSNQYIYFDIKTWECRLFSNLRTASTYPVYFLFIHAYTKLPWFIIGNLTSGLLHEDSVRVKFMTSS